MQFDGRAGDFHRSYEDEIARAAGQSGGSYRVYFLDSSNRIFGVEELDCKTDEEACGTARELGYTGGMEVWCGARLVARSERGKDLVPGEHSRL